MPSGESKNQDQKINEKCQILVGKSKKKKDKYQHKRTGYAAAAEFKKTQDIRR